LLSACLPLEENSQGKRIITELPNSLNSGGSGNGAQGGNGGVGGGTSQGLAKVEIRHLIDPFDGTYKSKLTLPRNFSGILYISGLNITALSDKLVKVRFRFGRSLDVVEVPALVGVGPGLTSTANISVLVLDMNEKPFKNIRLNYDLFDYSSYGKTEEPTTNNRDSRLYCRGLDLEYDSTFEGASGSCSFSGDKCLYSYAKIRDATLFDVSGVVPVAERPSIAQIGVSSNGATYNSDNVEDKFSKCLPDNGLVRYNDTAAISPFELNTAGTNTVSPSASPGTPVHTITQSDGTDQDFNFIGPYLAIDRNNWVISTTAAVHDHITEADPAKATARGLFMETAVANNIDTGVYSYLFPRAGKMSLSAGVQYLGGDGTGGAAGLQTSYHVTANRTLQSQAANGATSTLMDGCNFRAISWNSELQEHIGSCNVTATIEIITVAIDNKVTLLATSKELKLQLVRPSTQNSVGNEVLWGSQNSCQNNSGCASDACCFNDRCWEKTLVGACFNTDQNTGNNGLGENCSSDFDCASLCCNAGTNTCTPHDTSLNNPVFCNKSIGQTCVAKEFCRKEPVQECFIVKQPNSSTGQPQCSLMCYTFMKNGNCLNGFCQQPVTPTVPVFDPDNPDCSNAVDPPTQDDFDD
jgi:hypothetical protein